MPEGPEVLAISKRLQCLKNQFIKITSTNNARIDDDHPVVKCIKITTYGKNLILYLADGNCLLNRFGLTGSWVAEKSAESGANIRAELKFGPTPSTMTKHIYYHDPRNLGSINHMTNETLASWLANFGPDVLSKKFTFDRFKNTIGGHNDQLVATAIIDQYIIAGIGNYLRSEIIYTAKIKHDARVGDVNLTTLYKAICKTVKKSANRGGWVEYGGRYVPKCYGRNHDDKKYFITKTEIYGRPFYWIW
jgi:formamidopyrimidine-DNA glycosylase